jgi:hypothetical protein
MVEAAGIEPASASPLPLVTTCLVRSIVFNLLLPEGQGNQLAIPNWGFSESGPGPRHRDPV